MSEHIPSAEEIQKEVEKQVDEVEKQVDEVTGNNDKECGIVSALKKAFNAVVDSVTKTANCAQTTACSTVSRVGVELQNPVVLAQVAVIASASAAGYFAHLEKYKIKSDNRAINCLNAAALTALVLADGFLFNQYYSKYDKK
ncbi:uncharacterized protein SPAPADRAFT_57741 [Spathaspora passalidarum NRRL Y-27907]|uniref:Mitochondrial outer membrane protein OM14 C-terminal domain-containing protein n=1 Tax=Spathaspora passalidarum (strain NRRL Y-27907 / 11-Y1) TaxID=619300 RepID=G3ADW4_SPAPN|nr:uncharacterized protein SPAPADRAFT_57741 [Spathaspora passalidarum NRRL Y-27907]EGW34688.1 hypothetical protein SPAPADRAFT_57741 [Spathaspora passalidarum NRRL Y-27907]